MDYKVTIICRQSDLFVHPFWADDMGDIARGVEDAIAKWRRQNPGKTLLGKAACQILVERA